MALVSLIKELSHLTFCCLPADDLCSVVGFCITVISLAADNPEQTGQGHVLSAHSLISGPQNPLLLVYQYHRIQSVHSNLSAVHSPIAWPWHWLIDVVVVLLLWCQLSNSMSMTALAYLTVFDIAYLLTAAVSLWTYSKRSTAIYSFGYERFEVSVSLEIPCNECCCHTPHVTRHTSYVTYHTSYVTYGTYRVAGVGCVFQYYASTTRQFLHLQGEHWKDIRATSYPHVRTIGVVSSLYSYWCKLYDTDAVQ